MLNIISKSILFYFAYVPLISLVLVQNMDISLKLFIIIFLLVFLGYALTKLLLGQIDNIAPREEEVKVISEKNSETLNFIVTYVVPLCVPLKGINDELNLNNFISLIILLLIIYYLYLDTSLFCINPLLKILFGYNIYEVDMLSKKYFLLSKKIHSNESKRLQVKKLNRNLLIEEEGEEQNE